VDLPLHYRGAMLTPLIRLSPGRPLKSAILFGLILFGAFAAPVAMDHGLVVLRRHVFIDFIDDCCLD